MSKSILALSCALLAACGGRKEQARPPEDELWIPHERFDSGGAHVEEAREADLPQAVIAGGRIDFDDLRVTHVFSPVTGRVTRILARLGERVHKGTPLAAIASPDLGTAISDEVKARADLIAAERDWKRQQTLFAVHAAAQRDYEAAQDTYRRAKAEEDRALQRLRILRSGRINRVTQEYQLPSPIEGRVIARMVNPGVEVQGQYSGGTAVELFTIGDIDSVWLYADVPEEQLPHVQPGAAITARVLAYPDRVFNGRVEWISPALDPVLRTARIRCALPNPEHLLKPQMFGLVTVERPSARELTVPRSAVVRINDQSIVFIPAGERPDGKRVFKRRRIETADREGAVSRTTSAYREVPLPILPVPDLVPVLSGLTVGERVLIENLGPGHNGAETVALAPDQVRAGNIALEPVDERQVPDLVKIGGRLTFDDLRVTHVFPPVGGRITRVLAAPGQRVRKGTPLAVILSPDLGGAFSDMKKAEADLFAAEHAYQRQIDLAALRAGVQRDLEAARGNFDHNKAEYERAEQRTRLLRENATSERSQEFVLKSPIDGEITMRAANPGLEVQGQYNGAGNVVELFTIGELDPLWLLGDVFEMDLPYVKVGDEVSFQVQAFQSHTFRGRVDWISDVLDSVMRTAKVRVILRNPQGMLRPEMYELASVAVPTRKALSVPRSALLRLGEETMVFVRSGGRPDGGLTFERRRVLADEKLEGDRVPILAGLRPGESVAARGAIFLVGLM